MSCRVAADAPTRSKNSNFLGRQIQSIHSIQSGKSSQQLVRRPFLHDGIEMTSKSSKPGFICPFLSCVQASRATQSSFVNSLLCLLRQRDPSSALLFLPLVGCTWSVAVTGLLSPQQKRKALLGLDHLIYFSPPLIVSWWIDSSWRKFFFSFRYLGKKKRALLAFGR